jgi:hypothetical protein
MNHLYGNKLATLILPGAICRSAHQYHRSIIMPAAIIASMTATITVRCNGLLTI